MSEKPCPSCGSTGGDTVSSRDCWEWICNKDLEALGKERERLLLQNQEQQKEIERLKAWEKEVCATLLDRDNRLKESNGLNDELLEWVRAQGKSHHELAVQFRDSDDLLTEHNALSSAYFKIAKEIENLQKIENWNHEDPCPRCGFHRGSKDHEFHCLKSD